VQTGALRCVPLRDWIYASGVDEWAQHDPDQPFWLDYIADSGDGGAAT